MTLSLLALVAAALTDCRIESWTGMSSWYTDRAPRASDCEWLCRHVSEGCIDFLYSPEHDGVCHTYRCHEEACVLRQWSDMHGWYEGRPAHQGDCDWLCAHAAEREVCRRGTFLDRNNGMCTLYACDASPPPPSRPPRWRDGA